MIPNFVGLLFILSLGTVVCPLAYDESISSTTESPGSSRTERFSCISFIGKYLSTNDTRLQEFYLRAAEILCRPDFRTSAKKVGDCTEKASFRLLTKYQCGLRQVAETNCSAKSYAIKCVLDLAGALCGGKDAVLITALSGEYMILTSEQQSNRDCEIAALQERQKHPEPTYYIVPKDLDKTLICIELEEGLANATSDPEYYRQRAGKILCDGKQIKSFVTKTNKCIEHVIWEPESLDHCYSDDFGSAICSRHMKRLRCRAALYADRCGGKPALDVFAFQTEFSMDLWRAMTRNYKDADPMSNCNDELMAELRAMQKPKEDLVKGN